MRKKFVSISANAGEIRLCNRLTIDFTLSNYRERQEAIMKRDREARKKATVGSLSLVSHSLSTHGKSTLNRRRKIWVMRRRRRAKGTLKRETTMARHNWPGGGWTIIATSIVSCVTLSTLVAFLFYFKFFHLIDLRTKDTSNEQQFHLSLYKVTHVLFTCYVHSVADGAASERNWNTMRWKVSSISTSLAVCLRGNSTDNCQLCICLYTAFKLSMNVGFTPFTNW